MRLIRNIEFASNEHISQFLFKTSNLYILLFEKKKSATESVFHTSNLILSPPSYHSQIWIFNLLKFQFFSLSSQSSFQLSLTLLVFYRSSTLYLELDEIYHLFWTLISKNSTLSLATSLHQI